MLSDEFAPNHFVLGQTLSAANHSQARELEVSSIKDAGRSILQPLRGCGVGQNWRMTQFIIFLIIGVAGIVVGYYLAVRRKVKVSGSAGKRRQEKEARHV